MVLDYLQSKVCASLCFSASPPRIGYLSLWMHQGLSPPWFIAPRGITATHNMTSRLAIKFPTPYEYWSYAPPPRRLSSSNSLPPGQEKTSNARGMPGGMFKLRFDWYISISVKFENVELNYKFNTFFVFMFKFTRGRTQTNRGERRKQLCEDKT